MLDLTDRKNIFYWQTDRNLSPEDYDRIFLKRHEISSGEIISVLQQGITSISGKKVIIVSEPDENVKKGNVNIVRKVIVNDKPFVVRMHPRGVKNGYFYAEREALRAAKKNKIPVPNVIEIHEARDEKDMDFMLTTLSAGITMDVLLQNDKSTEKQLLFDCGAKMAQIHQIKVLGFGAFNNQIAKDKTRLVGLHNSYHDFIWTGLEENLKRLIYFKVITDKQASSMRSIFKTNNFEPIEGSRLIHNDFADWNVLTDGKRITAVLDWDECHAGDPIADLACWSTFFFMERFEKFLKGYTSVAKLPADFNSRFHFYRLRYTISKMALRIKRFQVDHSETIKEKLEVGKKALAEESAHFGC